MKPVRMAAITSLVFLSACSNEFESEVDATAPVQRIAYSDDVVFGRILAPNGSPRDGVKLHLLPHYWDATKVPVRQFAAAPPVGTTNAEGRFAIYGVAPGQYVLIATRHKKSGPAVSSTHPLEVPLTSRKGVRFIW